MNICQQRNVTIIYCNLIHEAIRYLSQKSSRLIKILTFFTLTPNSMNDFGLKEILNPFGRILELSSNTNFKIIKPMAKNMENLSIYKLPILDKKDIDYLKNNFLEKNEFISYLLEHGFNFPFISQNIEIILDMQQYTDYICVFVLFSYISWYCNYDLSSDVLENHLILQALRGLMQTSYSDIAISAFFHCVVFLVVENQFDDEISSMLREVLVHCNNLPNDIDKLYIIVLSTASNMSLMSIVHICQDLLVVFNERKGLFQKQTSQELAILLTFYIPETNIIILNTILSLIKGDLILKNSIIRNIPEQTLSKFDTEQCFIEWPLPESNIISLSINNSNNQFCFPDNETFSSDISFQMKCDYKWPEFLVDSKLSIIVDFYTMSIGFLESADEISIFFSNILHYIIEHSNFNNIGVYLYIFMGTIFLNSEKFQTIPTIRDLYFSCAVFDPKYLAKNNHKRLIGFENLRNESIKFILSQGNEKIFEEFISFIGKYPLLLEEFIFRIQSNKEQFFSFILKFPKSICVIRDIHMKYRFLHFYSENNIDTIQKTRISLFCILYEMSLNKDTLSLLFSSSYFLNSFFVFLFETNLRPFVLFTTMSFLKIATEEQIGQTFISLSSCIDLVLPYKNDPRSIDLMIDIIDFCTSYIRIRNTELIIDDVIYKILEILNSFSLSSSSLTVLFKCMSFFSQNYDCIKITPDHVCIMKDIIFRISNESIFTQIILMICGNDISKNSICQPVAITLALSVFEGQIEFSNVIDQLIILTKESIHNCEKCHQVQLGQYIVSYIQKNVTKYNDLFFKFIQLFYQISRFSSSASIVSEFFSLLSPLHEINDPLYYSTISDCMHYLTLDRNFNFFECESLEKSMKSFPISQNLPDSLHSMSFWINIIKIPYKFSFMSIQASFFNIHFYIDNMEVFLEVINVKYPMTVRFPLFSYQWSIILINYVEKTNSVDIIIESNRNLEVSFSITHDNDVTFDVKNVTFSECFIDDFKVFSGINNKYDIYSMIKTGPSSLRYPHQKLDNMSSFLQNIIKYQKNDLFLPVFPLISYYFLTECQNLVHIYIHSFFSTLVIADDQNLNQSSKAISSLFYILNTIPRNKLNFQIYHQLYTVFVCLCHSGLRYQVFSLLVFNPKLWITPGFPHTLSILQHWNSVLLPNILSFLIQPSFIDTLFSFPYFNNVEGDNILMSQEERLLIIECLQKLCSFSFSSLELNCLFAQCMWNKNASIVCDLLELLLLISRTNPTILRSSGFSRKHIFWFYEIFDRHDEDISSLLFDFIICVHIENIIPRSSFPINLEILSNRITKLKIGSKFIEKIITHTKKQVPELLPFSSCVLFFNEQFKDYSRDLFQSILPSPLYISSPIWFFWPLLLASISSDSIKSKILSFVLDCYEEEWRSIFSIIDLVCKSSLCDSQSLYDECISYLFSKYTSQSINNSQALYSFIDTAFFFFFHRPKYFHSPLLIQEFDESPYRLSTPLLTKRLSDYSTCPKAVYQRFLRVSCRNSYQYGLRISAKKEWLDIQHCYAFIRFIDESYPKRFIDIASLILYYIHKSNESFYLRSIVGKEFLNNGKFAKFINIMQQMIGRNQITSIDYETCFNNINELFDNSLNGVRKDSIDRIIQYIEVLLQEIEFDDPSNEFVELLTLYNEKTRFFENKHRLLSEDCQKNWGQLWYRLSIDKGPWDFSIFKENKTDFWIRDGAACWCKCPFRLKKNWSYDDHKSASKYRDKGEKEDSIINDNTHYCSIFSKENPDSISFSSFDSTLEENYKEFKKYACYLVQPRGVQDCILIFTSRSIELRIGGSTMSADYNDIREVLLRTQLHVYSGIEVFTNSGLSLFISFQGNNYEEPFKRLVNYCPKTAIIQNVPFLEFFKTLPHTNEWVQGKMSNFEYIMALNIYSGRSFNDLTQYPLFPWILTDYDSTSLDLSSPAVYRDLSKPLGALDSQRFTSFLDRLSDLIESTGEPGYLFPSGPISQLSICLLLIRLEPFSSHHIEIQGGKFDLPDRLFHSIAQTYNLVSSTGKEIWELLPEFYFMPEFLLNMNQFDLGSREGKPINDVIIPDWAENHFDFIYKNRKALESEYVSMRINKWIDLIWGYLQKDENNSYPDKLYEDVWNKYSNHDEMRAQIETFLTMIGQIPPQLFTAPHPQKSKYHIPQINNYVQKIEISDFICSKSNSDQLDFVLLVNKDLIVSRILIGTTPPSLSISIEDQVKIPYISKFSLDEMQGFLLSNNTLLLFFASDNNVILFDWMKKTFISSKLCDEEVGCISVTNDWIVLSNKSSFISIYEIADLSKRRWFINTHFDNILCLDTSSVFRTYVGGSANGSLLIGSLPSGNIIRVVDLADFIPMKVIISPSWGFIIVYAIQEHGHKAEHFLLVYNINGFFLRKTDIDSPIDNWTCWTSHSGFDYLAFSTKKGKHYYCEVYYLNIISIFSKKKLQSKGIYINRDLNLITSIGKDGFFINEQAKL